MFGELKEAGENVVLKIRDGKRKLIYGLTGASVISAGGIALMFDGYMHNNYMLMGLGIGIAVAGAFGIYHVNGKIDQMLNDATKDAFVKD